MNWIPALIPAEKTIFMLPIESMANCGVGVFVLTFATPFTANEPPPSVDRANITLAEPFPPPLCHAIFIPPPESTTMDESGGNSPVGALSGAPKVAPPSLECRK